MGLVACEDYPDIIISGHPDDMELITFLAEGFAKEHMTVWFPSDQKKMDVSQLIPQCKVYVIVLSPSSLTLDDMKDDIALAYMANVAIFPAANQSHRKLSPLVDGGLKLMLSRIQWTFFLKPEHFEPNFANLLSSINRYVTQEYPKQAEENENDPFSMLHGHLAAISNANNDDQQTEEDEQEPKEPVQVGDFWKRHFGKSTVVSFILFKEKFSADYSERISSNFGDDKKKLFENLLYKDIFNLMQVLPMERYNAFVGKQPTSEPDAFYNRLQAYVSSSLATRQVLDMDSTVRMTAIQQLGNFKTPHVVKQLKNLTSDADPNIRAVAALALAKTGIKDKEIEDLLISLLSNKDRLVRESACLSLAHMQSARAMKRVIHLWRNDPISHVRQAAELALSRMGMDEAKEAMKITSVLTQEVAALREAGRQQVASE